MAHFAQIDEKGVVQRVLVIEQDVVDSGNFGDPKSWVQTSYNSMGGVHLKGGTHFRKNFAATGYVYDKKRDAFIPPKPDIVEGEYVLDEDLCLWVPADAAKMRATIIKQRLIKLAQDVQAGKLPDDHGHL